MEWNTKHAKVKEIQVFMPTFLVFLLQIRMIVLLHVHINDIYNLRIIEDVIANLFKMLQVIFI